MRGPLIALALGAIFLGWNAPNHYPPWPTFHVEALVCAALPLLALATMFPRVDASGGDAIQVPVRAHAAFAGWFLVGFIPLVQWSVGILFFRGDALVGCLYAVGVALALYLGRLWAMQSGREAVVRSVLLLFVIAALSSFGLGLTQWLGLPPPGWWAMELIDGRPYANLGQPNHFGLLMAFGIVAIHALFELSVVGRIAHHFAFGLLGFGVVISGSRASVVALGVIALVWLWQGCSRSARLRPLEIVVAGFAFWIAWVALPVWRADELLVPIAERAMTDVGPRELIWRHFWYAIEQRPWFGYGFNQGSYALAEVAQMVQPSRNTAFAHNFLLDLMAWIGIPGALILALALLAWIARMLRPREEKDAAIHGCAAFGIWLVLLVQSLFEFPFAHLYFLLPAALLAGAAEAPIASGRGNVWRWSRPVMMLALISFVAFVTVCRDYFVIDKEFRAARFEAGNISLIGGGVMRSNPGDVYVLDQLRALVDSASWPLRRGMSEQELERRRILARRFKADYVRLDYAKALYLNRGADDAEAELLIMRSVLPDSRYEAVRRRWVAWQQAQAPLK